MLKICRSYWELNIHQLLAVCAQTLEAESVNYFQAEQDFCDYLREDFFSADNALYALWSLEGRYVSALRIESYRDGYLLSGLETAPQDRRKGYAKCLIEAVCREYIPIYSHVHKKNAASIALHQACGFVPVLDYGVLLDGTVSYNYLTLCHK